MLSSVDPGLVPPGGWRWKHPATSYVVRGSSFAQVLAAARQFLAANQLPVPRDLDQQILGFIREEIRAEADRKGLNVNEFFADTEPPSPAERARNFARAMVDWARSGFAVADQKLYEQRREICEGCYYWRGETALGYGSCAKCGCTGLKLFVKGQTCPIGKW
jgi:hypothetical protein